MITFCNWLIEMFYDCRKTRYTLIHKNLAQTAKEFPNYCQTYNFISMQFRVVYHFDTCLAFWALKSILPPSQVLSLACVNKTVNSDRYYQILIKEYGRSTVSFIDICHKKGARNESEICFRIRIDVYFYNFFHSGLSLSPKTHSDIWRESLLSRAIFLLFDVYYLSFISKTWLDASVNPDLVEEGLSHDGKWVLVVGHGKSLYKSNFPLSHA